PTYAGPVRTGPFDPSAPPGTLANVYHALQYVVAFIGTTPIQVEKSTDGGVTFNSSVLGLDLSNTFDTTVFPLAVNPVIQHDINGFSQDELLFRTDKIFESDNSGGVWDPVSARITDVITALAFGPSGDDVFYAGTKNGKVFVDL